MREIKFRAWDSSIRKMSPVMSIDWHLGVVDLPLKGDKWEGPHKDPGGTYRMCIPQCWPKVMQFTGLKDKNGKEIYEGDILSFEFDNTSANYISVVQWEKDMTECCQSSFDGYRTKDIKNSVVIGNIYENPELLK